MPGIADIAAAAAPDHLAIRGGFPTPAPEPHLPPDTRTLLVLGQAGGAFWDHFRASAEMADGMTDPLDRWSKRVIGALARRFRATAIFPSDGPPYAPFYTWALRTARFHVSPIGLLVHPEDGLLASLRGALALPYEVEIPPPLPSPCRDCPDKPCLSTCPVGAFGAAGYTVTTCHNHLDTPAGSDCMERGCAARRACPASQGARQRPEQSAFHMRAFHRGR